MAVLAFLHLTQENALLLHNHLSLYSITKQNLVWSIDFLENKLNYNIKSEGNKRISNKDTAGEMQTAKSDLLYTFIDLSNVQVLL